MTFPRIVIPLQLFDLSMISAQTRFPRLSRGKTGTHFSGSCSRPAVNIVPAGPVRKLTGFPYSRLVTDKSENMTRRDSGYPSTDSRSGVHSLVRIESEVQSPRRFRMALEAHLVELERKHKILENELHEALVHLSTDDLQIVKLMVKDEIERLKHTVSETLH